MTTGTVAMAALKKVAEDTFVANAGDPTWGTLYANMTYELNQPFGIFKGGINTVYLYKTGGQPAAQGLGFTKQWRQARIRVDVLCDTYANAEQTFEALRSAWITDYGYVAGNGSVGQGYLRITGGIKYLLIGESQSAPWEARGLVFRRIADINIEIGD